MTEAASTKPPVLSLVLPACNEAANVAPLHERLARAVEAAGFADAAEFIWVDDGSTDGTAERVEALAAADPRVRLVRFSRNFGHMAALTAGLDAARATGAVIMLDADGQHPPELIPDLVARWRAGAEIVQAVRRATADEPPLKRLTSRGFYRLLNHLGEVRLPEGASDFRLLDRQVADALRALPERHRFVRGLVHWVGFQMDTVPYDAPPRLAGRTKYSPARMLLFALDGITSFSVKPLRLAFGLGAAVLVLALIYGIYVIATWAAGRVVPGWTSLLLVVLIMGSIQLLTLGVMGVYIGRIYDEVKQRPLYIVRKPRR
ncbi:MAG: glycosyltransferase family 2 protein [Candidatus Sumerlaeaceae bacterium]|nr:glycosyltransferase family 2 protein [Candidatus Sumerlaeaceae bacterium]